MTDAGFFRGTSSDQDNRFANKQKKLLKGLNFSPICNTKLNMSKIDVEALKPWIEGKIKDVLEKDDDILSASIFEHLAEKEPDAKNILMLIMGFVDENKASKFVEELWTKLVELQDNSNGLGSKLAEVETNDSEHIDDQNELAPKVDKLAESNNNSNDNVDKPSKSKSGSDHHGSESSHSVTPPSRSVSKSPGRGHKLDEKSRGRPRKRLQDDNSKDGSKSPQSRHSRSRSNSRSRSRSAHRRTGKPGSGDEATRRSRSSSRSKGSGSVSRSRSGSYSRSRSRSYSKSRSRSPVHRSRSPYSHSYRGRRSRSPSRGYRPRSRSPRGRRGYIGGRGSYRGNSFGFHDRRRGGLSGPMRRRSPWGRRRFSPRSPPRRRRTPSFSPRRRRSPSPYTRRYSHSRSPPPHINRNIQSPRGRLRNMSGPGGNDHLDMSSGRHMPHHDMQRQMLPLTRSPRVPIDHRSYRDGHMLPRHSPGPTNQPLDLPPTSSHGLTTAQSGPAAGSGLYSPPSSGKKKHKKEKKHRKHKKSKKHRSASPEKKKKHKKHKKTKKHKSH